MVMACYNVTGQNRDNYIVKIAHADYIVLSGSLTKYLNSHDNSR